MEVWAMAKGGGNSRQRKIFETRVREEVSRRVIGEALPAPQIQKPEKNIWQRLLDFIEHGYLLTTLGLLGGLVGLFVYTPVLLVCVLSLLLAFHRARVVAGKKWY